MYTNSVCIDRRDNHERTYLQDFPVTLGRSPEADVLVGGACTSRLHCEIDILDGTLVVRDLNSRNGTLVNGCRVSKSPLMPGDELLVGATAFQVVYERRSLVPAPPVVYESTENDSTGNRPSVSQGLSEEQDLSNRRPR